MSLEICPHSDEHKPVIRNLLQFYCYDTSNDDEYDVEPDGLYALSDEYFGRYWTDPRWSAHLLRWDGAIAGFALIEASEALPEGQELADLFVLKRFRRKGIGRAVARHFMTVRSVPWTVVVFDQAHDARAFWTSLFAEPELRPARQVADPDARPATVHVLDANRAG